MSGLAPSWAFSAQAINSAGDPHLAPGVHIRLFLHPKLGLPIFPFRVYRVNLGIHASGAFVRDDSIVWTDSGGAVLTPPFTVRTVNSVTAWLPSTSVGTCSWIQIQVKGDPPKLTPFSSTNLQMQAMIAGENGPSVISTSNGDPYEMAASRIDRVRVSGQGDILGATWLDSNRLASALTAPPWRMWSLPVPSGPNYSNSLVFNADADARVQRGGPLRLAMYDAVFAQGPKSAPTINNPGPSESSRISFLTAKQKDWLSKLVNSNATPPHQVTDTLPIADGSKLNAGTASVNCLSSVLAACLDPSMARFCGFGDVDNQPPTELPNAVVAYIIRGGWQLNLADLSDPDLKATIPSSAMVDNLNSILPPGISPHPKQQAPYLDMFTVAAASLSPSAQAGVHPPPPVLKTVIAGPWMPLTPPIAQREMIIRAEGLTGAVGIALVRKENNTLVGLNPQQPNGAGIALIPSPPGEAATPGVSDFFDRGASPGTTGYRLAQCDWFGRWSDWSEIGATLGPRPNPPRPVLHFDYVPPNSPSDTGPLSGTILLTVPIPKPDALPPASLLVTKLEVVMNNVLTTAIIPNPVPADNVLHVPPLAGPKIPLGGKATVNIIARWVNSGDVKSNDSDPISRTLWDPRPAEPVKISDELAYGSRPDITGKSRMELRWSAAGAQKRFRVFYADETTLTAAIERIKNSGPAHLQAEAITILNALSSAKTIVDRANVFKAHRSFLTRDMFELITGTPVEPDPKSSTNQLSFVHLVSGALRVLSLFRIVSVTEANVESSFADALLIPYGVPNSPRPAQPLLDVKPILPDLGGLPQLTRITSKDIVPPNPPPADPVVSVTIRVPRGTAQAVGYRLRRSSSSAADPVRMPIIRTGLISPPLKDEMQIINLTDSNQEAIPGAPGKLKFWNTYLWRAETRAAGESGGGPEGEWSPASTPVSLTVIPPEPPQPVTNLSIQVLKSRDVEITCTHAIQLNGGAMGRYKLDVYRQRPGEREKYLKSIFADAAPADGGQDSNGRMRVRDTGPSVDGTRYRVVVVDPMGRSSEPSAAVQI